MYNVFGRTLNLAQSMTWSQNTVMHTIGPQQKYCTGFNFFGIREQYSAGCSQLKLLEILQMSWNLIDAPEKFTALLLHLCSWLSKV